MLLWTVSLALKFLPQMSKFFFISLYPRTVVADEVLTCLHSEIMSGLDTIQVEESLHSAQWKDEEDYSALESSGGVCLT